MKDIIISISFTRRRSLLFTLLIIPILISIIFLLPDVVTGRRLLSAKEEETEIITKTNHHLVRYKERRKDQQYNNINKNLQRDININNNKHSRYIQEVSTGGVEYRAKYIAEYQYLRDTLCLGPNPVIKLYCFGNMNITSTSHPTINCTTPTIDTSDGWTVSDCTNTCNSETECKDIFLNIGGTNIQVGPFANITYECYGTTISDVDSAIAYENSGNGACVAAPDTRNFHVARMGILCNDNNEDNDNEEDNDSTILPTPTEEPTIGIVTDEPTTMDFPSIVPTIGIVSTDEPTTAPTIGIFTDEPTTNIIDSPSAAPTIGIVTNDDKINTNNIEADKFDNDINNDERRREHYRKLYNVDSIYTYDDYYFECTFGSTIFPADGFPDNPGDVYTCFVGDNCQGSACDVEFDRLVIDADVANFQDKCVTPTVVQTQAPTSSDNIDTGINLAIKALFQTAWILEFDEFTGSQCSGYTPTIRITCIDSDIEFINTTSTTMDCNQTDTNTLDCIDTSAFINDFTGVNYTCTGAALPQTRVEYPELDASCDGNVLEATISEKLQLGVFCNLDGGFFFWGDFYVECGTESSNFEWIDNIELGTSQYTCSESVFFPVGSTSSEIQTIPAFSMMTDPDWDLGPDESCYEFITLNGEPTTPTPIVSSPAPTIDTSTAAPTVSPTSAATTIAPTFAITASASPQPSTGLVTETPSPTVIAPPVQTTTAPTQYPANNTGRGVPIVDDPSDSSDSDSSSSVGGIVGGVVGGVVVIALIALAVFFLKSRKSRDGSEQKQQTVTAPPPPVPPVAANNNNNNAQTNYPAGGGNDSSSDGDDISYGDMPTESIHAEEPMQSSNTPAHVEPSVTNTVRTSRTQTSSSSSHRIPHAAMPAPARPLSDSVNFKDQARTVIGSSDDVPIVEGVAVPMYDNDMMAPPQPSSPSSSRRSHSNYNDRTSHRTSNNSDNNNMPQTINLDTSTSDISDGTGFTGFTRRSADPDGRIAGIDP